MNPLTLLTGFTGSSFFLPVIGIGAAALVSWGGIQTYRVSSAKNETLKVQQKYDAEVIRTTQLTLEAETAKRERETQRQQDKEEIVNAAQQVIEKAKVEVAVANDASRRVSDYADSLVARARKGCPNPTLSTGGSPAPDSTGVLALLLKRADKRAGILATYADASREAGLVCEQQYDSLTKP